MKKNIATVRRVTGTCNAGYRVGDQIIVSVKYSAYNWARIDGRATAESKVHCGRSWELTQAGDYAQAEREIERAIAHLSGETP